MKVRFANKEDFDGISVIQTQVHKMHNEFRPDLYKNVNNALDKEYFFSMVEKSNVIVAEKENQIVGYCIFAFKEHKETAISFGRKALFIEAIGVLENCKRNGIGKTMFSFIENIAKENGCDTIELGVNVKNKDAIEFYKVIGMVEKNIVMDYRMEK